MTNLQTALTFTLHEEGGLVDNPADPGGRTNHGITQATYNRYRNSLSLPSGDVADISDYEVEAIYSEMYWTPAHCPDLRLKLAVCHFDWAVNHGVTGAILTLQTALGVTADGVFGAQSQAAASREDEETVITAYNSLRRARYQSLAEAEPSLMQFLKGWLNRVAALESYLETLSD